MQGLWQKLQNCLRKHAPLAIAFSGGLDSRLLAFAAKQAQVETLLLHATGVHMPEQESNYALAWAKKQDLNLQCVQVDVLSLDAVRSNDKKRCYYCKKYLMNTLQSIAKANALNLVDGTNADDMQSHRPGLKALQEHNVFSPLAACGLSKENVRNLAQAMGLDNASQKARPCLLTRFNYGTNMSREMLLHVAAAEYELEKIGLLDFRLRLCPDPILQTVKHDIAPKLIENTLNKHGFTQVKIVVSAEVSGFFDVNAIK